MDSSWSTNKMAYCHTTCDKSPYISKVDYIDFEKDKWYIIYHESDYSYVIQHFEYANIIRTFYKYSTQIPGYKMNTSDSFSEYFYTEQEYNRYKNLDDLLDG